MRFILTLGLGLTLAGICGAQVFEPIRKAEEGDKRGSRWSFTLQACQFDWDLPGNADALFEGKDSFLASIDYDLGNNWSVGAWFAQDTQEFNFFTATDLETDWMEIHATRTFSTDDEENSTVAVQFGLMQAELDLGTVSEDLWATVSFLGSTALDGGDDPKFFLGGHFGYAMSIEGDDFLSSDASLFAGQDAFMYGISLSYSLSDSLSLVASYWGLDFQADNDSFLINSVERVSFGIGYKF